ncbi:MAG: hypothetical protein NT166_30200 [Candidatus Aminicenantes bacterium]|nr:hypothetical protein [Candidatus Aminicenantes bacterium]
MKKTIRKLYPIFFGLALFLFYIAIYPSPAGADDYSTALAVFFTALGSSAVIIFPRREAPFLYYSYLLGSLAFPILAMSFFHFFKTAEQKAIIGVQALALILLVLFVSYQPEK